MENYFWCYMYFTQLFVPLLLANAKGILFNYVFFTCMLKLLTDTRFLSTKTT